MSDLIGGARTKPPDEIPLELQLLMERIQALPREVRDELEPMVDQAMEEAVFRGRVLKLAREALERFRLDLELTRFDLEATRRERERLRRLLHSY